jgi:two-component system, sensor histidine kinase and response regulator
MTTRTNGSIPWTFVLNEPVRILVVDDDPLLCEFASVYLSSPCASIDIACDAAAARLALTQYAYDILLLDIEMPQVDGFALLAEIRASDEHLPIIMLTGHDDIVSIDRAYQIGASSFATKPVNWRQLSYQIRQVVRTSQPRGLPTPASRDRLKESGSEPTPDVTDVRVLLQTVIDRANALEEQLAAHDGERWSELARGVRSFTSLCQTFRMRPESRTDGPRQLEPADRCDAA